MQVKFRVINKMLNQNLYINIFIILYFYNLATKYDVQGLIDEINTFLANILAPNNVIRSLNLAEKYNNDVCRTTI